MIQTVMKMLLCTALLAALNAAAQAQDTRQFGGLNYPAPGNIHWDEGTMELWFRLDRDFTKEAMNVMFFDVVAREGEGWHFPLMYINWGGQAIAQIGYTKPQQSYVWSGRLEWKAGERHCLVWTWSGRLRSIYMDGKYNETGPLELPIQENTTNHTSANVEVEGPMRGTLTGAKLWIGMGYSPLTIDEIRISSIARGKEELARIYASGQPPTRDPFTLLLDHCDGGPAEVISGFSGETGGTIYRHHKIVDGQFGKAIQLWTDNPP